MAGKRARLRGIRQAPKRLESDILARSEVLADNPGVMRPKCTGSCWLCTFNGTFSKISKIAQHKGDAEKLTKLAAQGSDDIARAYAGAISLAAAGSIPYLATAKFPDGDVVFAIRGQVGNDKLIGAEYYDDPKLRLLLFNSIAKKKGLHMYSLNDDLVCCNKTKMPMDYLLDLFWETPYEFKDDGLTCGHDSDGVLVITVKSLNESIRICSNCVKDVSTLQFLISRLIANDPLDDFEVKVEHKYHQEKEGAADQITEDILKQYSAGKITDAGIIDLVLKGKKKDLQNSGTSAYIIDKKHYGSDLEGFVNDLKGNDLEKRALKTYLEGKTIPMILRSDRMTEALAYIWKDDATGLLMSVASKDIVDSMGHLTKRVPSEALEEANTRQMSAEVVSQLPEFKNLGPIGKITDKFARAAKVGGIDMLKKEMESASLKENRAKAVARAFIICVSEEEHKKMKPNKEEEDFAVFLQPFIKKILESNGKDYAQALENILTASSSGERL